MSADDPFAALGGPQGDDGPDASEPATADPAHDPFGNLGRADLPAVGPESATRTIDLLRHPVLSAGALGDYFKQHMADTYRHGTVFGAASGGAADVLTQGSDEAQNGKVYAEAERRRRLADERAERPRPAGSVPEAVAGFAGDVVGSIPSPESMISIPLKFGGLFGRPAVKQIVEHAAGAAAANTVADPAIQTAQMARGYQDEYDPFQTLMAPVVGAVAGAGIGGAHHVAGEVADVGRFMVEGPKGIPSYEPPAPVTVESLWQRLLNQEGGTDKSGKQNTSPAGAKGPAQLMPATAREVANSIGRPELAEMAFGEGPLANTANELLGKIYLDRQLRDFDGDPMLALAAYNAGPGAVRRWIKTFGHPSDVGEARWAAMIPYEETRNYVHSILGDQLGEPHALTHEDQAYMRGRMDSFPQEAETPLPSLERLVKEQDEKLDHEFPGDRPAAGAEDDGFPGDAPRAGENSGDPSPKEIPEGEAPSGVPEGMDLHGQAIEQLRSGKPLRLGDGPSLAEFLVKQGGIRDDGGEIANLLGGQGQDRFWKQLRRSKSGITLSEAVERAQREGYIGKPLGDQAGEFTQGEAADHEHLLEALRREIAGKKVYPPERVNEHARMLGEHMDDLQEILDHLGMDPKAHTHEEIRAAIDQFMTAGEHEHEMEPGSMGLKGELLGMKPGQAQASGAEAVQRVRAAVQRAQQRNEIVMGTTSRHLRGARTPGANPAPRDASGAVDIRNLGDVRGLPEIVRRLANALGYPIRQGRLGMRGALGTYNRRSGMVRSRGRYDLNTVAHEFGHALEFTDGHQLPNVVAAMKRHSATLKALDYQPNAARRHEGFAEWFRWYITNPAFADSRPGGAAFRQDFEAALRQDAPKMLDAIQEAQRDYQAHLDAPSLAATREHVISPPSDHPVARLMRTVAEKGPFGALKDLSDEAYRGTVDFLDPWQRAVAKALDIAEKRTGVRPTLSVMQDPYKLLRSMASVTAVGHMDLIHGVHGYHSLVPDSPSFADAMALALGDRFFKWDEDAIQDFGTYLVGRRVLHLYDRVGQVTTDANGRSHGIEQPPDMLSKESWAQTVEDLEAANPQWSEAADQLYQWNNALWQKRRDSGLISDADYTAGLEDHPDYVPLFRDISDKEFGGDLGGQRGKGTKQAGGVVRLRGSDRAYINPLHSMMNMAYELNAQIARNDALRALDQIGRIFGPDVGQVVERIPATSMNRTPTSVEEVIAGAARHYGVSRRDAAVITEQVRQLFGAPQDDAMNTAIYRSEAVGENGEPIVYLWENGERVPLRLPDGKWGEHMVEGLAGMTTPIRSALLDMAAIPAAALRAGVTAHPAFFLANSFRDQMTAFVLTDVGYRPGWDQLRGLGHELHGMVADDELSRIYNVASGEIGGYQSAAAHEAHAQRDLQALRQRGAQVRHFATWNGFAHATEMSETGTRLGIFERGFEQARRRGMDDYSAAREAAFTARDYMDFDRHGAWASMRILARVTPFLNAGIQALDKTRRVSGISKEGGTAVAAVLRPLFGGGGPPATPEQYRAFSHAMKLWITAGVLAVGGLAIRAAYRDDPEYQEVADQVRNTHWVVKLPDGYFAVIPKPYELAVLSNVLERGFEATALKDPTAWGRLSQGLEDIFIPAHDPAFAMPIINVLRNRDNLGAPIVPDYLKGREARDQYTDRTSEVAKFMGNHVGGEAGTSPAVWDYLAKAWGGSNVRDVLDSTVGRAPIARSPADTFVMKRFVKDWTRGSVSTKEFYDRVAADDGKWSHAGASVTALITDGKYPEAIARLKQMDPAERAYVMVQTFAEGDRHKTEGDTHADKMVKQDHPMARAAKAGSALSGLARDLADGNVRGPDLQPIQITPGQRREAIRALREMATAEQRNAMIMSGVPGWKDRPPLPQEKYALAFQRATPELVPALVQKFEDEKVQDINTTAHNWANYRAMVEQPLDDAALTRMMEQKRFPQGKKGFTQDALKRAHGDVVPVTP